MEGDVGLVTDPRYPLNVVPQNLGVPPTLLYSLKVEIEATKVSFTERAPNGEASRTAFAKG